MSHAPATTPIRPTPPTAQRTRAAAADRPTGDAAPSRAALLPGELAELPSSYTVRHVDVERAVALETTGVPRSGDLVLAEVVSLGHHARLENGHGRRAVLEVGARIVVAYGARYASDQFEAVVPDDLGPCELVAGGGIAARVLSKHDRVRDATTIAPLGLLVDADGRRLSTADGARAPLPVGSERPLVLLVAGASMNAGKTTTARMLCSGLAAAGRRVGAAKVTGTGSGNDTWAFHDGGARPVLDFTDFGHPSTWGVPLDELARVFEQSVAHLGAAGCEVAVIEIADGLLQADTAALLRHPTVRSSNDGLVFAATDALCGVAGLAWLREHGIEALAVTGVVSASPLASRELEAATGCAVWGSRTLADPAAATALVETLLARRSSRP